MTKALFSDDVLAKARKLVNEGRVRLVGSDDSQFMVRGSTGIYLVDTDVYLTPPDGMEATFAMCSCPYGKFNSARISQCSHAAAALLYFKLSHTDSEQE
jgi:hypothetical protein